LDGYEIVLTADETLLAEYRNIPLGPFLSCIPSDPILSRAVHHLISPKSHANEEFLSLAPLGLRKFESALARDLGKDKVAVVSPKFIKKFIGEKTKVVGIHSMDPIGLGPVSTMFTMGGKYTPYTKYMTEKLLMQLPEDRNFKVVIGGPGSWQFEYKTEVAKQWGIDHIVIGECDRKAGEVMEQIIDGASTVIKIRDCPPAEEIPPNLGATMFSMVEVMRGCGRGCKFCQPNLRKARYIPHEIVRKDIEKNVKAGFSYVWVHSDDIFLYKVESKELYPNREAIEELFSFIMNIEGVKKANPTHGSLAPIAADPELITSLTKILGGNKNNWIGIQPGFETGSNILIEKTMPRKALPFSPSEWENVVFNAVKKLNENYWLPAMTLIIGLPKETEEDVIDTINLVKRLENAGFLFIVAPLAFVPLAAWRNEQFFDVEKEIDEARFNLIYYCWRHTIIEIDRLLPRLTSVGPFMKYMINFIAKFGSRAMLKRMEKWGKKQGYKIMRL